MWNDSGSGYSGKGASTGGNDNGSGNTSNTSNGFYGQQPSQQTHQPNTTTNTTTNAFIGYEQQQQQNARQWQAPSQSTEPQQQQQHPQQNHSQAQPPQVWNPNNFSAAANVMSAVAASGMSNDTMLNLATTAGQQFFQSGTAQMIPGLETAMKNLRIYFAVDNRYVKRKIQRILFPFAFKQWKRIPSDKPGPDMQMIMELPLSDENAPDLYLPFMSLITYVLLCALCYGTAGQFNPEVLPDVTTKCFATQLLEVCIIRFGMYTMQAPASFLDLFSYTGYKYLGLVVNMLVGILAGSLGSPGYGKRAYYVTFVWTASAASYFILKTMANNIPLVTAATGPKREIMVCAFAASQFISTLFVSQTKFLE